jgi:hypothetical protein
MTTPRKTPEAAKTKSNPVTARILALARELWPELMHVATYGCTQEHFLQKDTGQVYHTGRGGAYIGSRKKVIKALTKLAPKLPPFSRPSLPVKKTKAVAPPREQVSTPAVAPAATPGPLGAKTVDGLLREQIATSAVPPVASPGPISAKPVETLLPEQVAPASIAPGARPCLITAKRIGAMLLCLSLSIALTPIALSVLLAPASVPTVAPLLPEQPVAQHNPGAPALALAGNPATTTPAAVSLLPSPEANDAAVRISAGLMAHLLTGAEPGSWSVARGRMPVASLLPEQRSLPAVALDTYLLRAAESDLGTDTPLLQKWTAAGVNEISVESSENLLLIHVPTSDGSAAMHALASLLHVLPGVETSGIRIPITCRADGTHVMEAGLTIEVARTPKPTRQSTR